MSQRTKLIIAAFTVALADLVAVAIYAAVYDESAINELLSDVTLVGGGSPLYRRHVQLGSLPVVRYGFNCCVCGNARAPRGWRADARFLLVAAAVTFYMWFDDFFLVHEEIAPHYLGIKQRFVYAGIAAMLATYFWLARKEILRNAWWLMGLALSFFALSAGCDVMSDLGWVEKTPWLKLAEDGAKWLGIVSWTVFHVDAAYSIVSGEMRSSGQAY